MRKKDKNRFKRFLDELKRKNKAEGVSGGALIKKEFGDISYNESKESSVLFTERLPHEKNGSADIRKRRAVVSISVWVTAICIFLSLAIVGASVYLSFHSPIGSVVGADVITEDILDSEGHDKIIFVRDDNGDSGYLSASEIYYQNLAASVTVVATYDKYETLGSGFVFSEDGYIATSDHIIDGAKMVSVIFSDGREYGARVVSGDKYSDVALLKIEATGLSAVRFGRSEDLLVGERVYVIGTPMSREYAGTLGLGDISYVGRSLSIYGSAGELDRKINTLQTSLSLENGNSGSPVFDSYGMLIGMAAMRISGENAAMSFVLPSDGVLDILNAMKDGKVVDSIVLSGIVTFPASLGVVGVNYEESGVFGYRITGFSADETSSAVFLRIGDMITKIDGEIVCSWSDISAILEEHSPGDTVSVTVIRSGQSLAYDIMLGEKIGEFQR